MTYPEALRYLDSFIDYERQTSFAYPDSYKLDRVEKLLEAVGNPHESFMSILVAGTKGKGSTCAFTHSILHEAGFKTGLYTSPHLRDFRERIRVGHDWIPQEAVVEMVEVLRGPIHNVNQASSAGPLTFFEVYTVLAFLYFARQKVEAAVVEVGMGGRFDATNILDPAACAITPISLDHTDHLGKTLGAIAAEKAGIIKRGSIVISSPQSPEAGAVLEKTVLENRAKLVQIGREVTFEGLGHDPDLQFFSLRGLLREYPRLAVSLLGPHQAINAACAVTLCESLSMRGTRIPDEAVERGLRNARWPGRFDVVSRDPLVILDGAQNEGSARALREAIRLIFPKKKVVLMLGVSQGKDVEGIGRHLLPMASRVVCTQAANPRALSAKVLKVRLAKRGKRVRIAVRDSVHEALEHTLPSIKKGELLLVAGSLYVVGEALSWFEKDA